MKRAVIYARVSTERQKDEQTIQTQLDETMAAIKLDNELFIEGGLYQDDGWSGAYLERPALDQLRQDAKQGKFDILYVFDKGRLARKFVHQEIVIEELRNIGIEFKSLHDINGSSPEEQLMGSVMGIFHEYERVKTSERFRLAKLSKVRNGQLLGYNAPYGYNYIPVTGKGTSKTNGRFEINEAEARIVRMIFEWVGDEGVTLREVIRRLYEQGIPTAKGIRQVWTKGPITRLLRNETYIGKHSYNKSESCLPKTAPKEHKHYRHTNKTSRRMRDKTEWLEVASPRIVDDALFNRAQKQLELNAKFAQRNKKNQYLFGTLVYCSCGQKRVGEGVTNKIYYRCTDRLHTFPMPRTCLQGGVNATVLDAAAWQKLALFMTDPALIKEQCERYQEKRLSGVDEKQEDTTRQIKLLRDEERRYAKVYGQGLLSESIYKERMSDVIKRQKQLESALNTPTDPKTKQLRSLDLDAVVRHFTQLMEKIDFEGKLFTVRKIVDKVIATKEEVILCCHLPVLTLAPAGKVGLHAEHRHCWPA